VRARIDDEETPTVKRQLVLAAFVLSLALVAAVAAAEPTPPAAALNKPPAGAKVVSAPSGLQYVDIVAGTGAAPMPGDLCIVHYTAWLDDGREIDTSKKARPDRKDPSKEKILPFGFKLGSGQVIRGWDEGVATMREGGTRLLFIPPQLAYGSKGAGNVIPPDARLTFRVELLKVKHEAAATPSPAP
jgi:peptidylprolyl isomerase